jgi:hypothetical protein
MARVCQSIYRCNANSYAPNSQTCIQCGDTYVVSPVGSWSPDNCTCTSGTYGAAGRNGRNAVRCVVPIALALLYTLLLHVIHISYDLN